MVFLIGINFSDRLLVSKALTSLYGISQTSAASYARAPSHYPANKAAASSTQTTPASAVAKSTTTSSSTSSSKDQNQDQKTSLSQLSRTSYITPPPSVARHSLLSRLMAKHHIHPTATMGSLTDATVQALSQSLSELTIENDLRRKMREDISRLVQTGTYRGMRHVKGLPVRGQRTRSQITTARKLNRVERRN